MMKSTTPDVVFVVPPRNRRVPTTYPARDNLGIAYLTSSLRENDITVSIIEANSDRLTYEDTIEQILGSKAKIVAYSLYQDSFTHFQKLIKTVKNKLGSLQIAGGHHATFAYKSVLKGYTELDAIYLGMAENSFPAIIKSALVNGNFYNLPHIVTHKNLNGGTYTVSSGFSMLDDLPLPARDVIERASGRSKVLAVMSSRGCSGRCHFCSCWKFYHKCNMQNQQCRSASSVVSEMHDLILKHGENEGRIHVIDDDFLGGPNHSIHAKGIAKEILKKDINLSIKISARSDSVIANKSLLPTLRQAGFDQVFLGIESGDDSILERYGKGVTAFQNSLALSLLRKNHMLDPTCGFILFNAETTIKEVRSCLNFLEKNSIVDPSVIFWRVEIQPGTTMESQMKRKGLLLPNYSHKNPHGYRFENEIAENLWKAFKQFRSKKLHEASSLLYHHDRLLQSVNFAFKDRFSEKSAELLIKSNKIRERLGSTLYSSLNKIVDEAEGKFRMDYINKTWERGWKDYSDHLSLLHSTFLALVSSLSNTSN